MNIFNKSAQLAAYFIFLTGILPIAASAQPYTISTDGSEVTENTKLYTGLIWRRCAEGMVYKGGTCNGIASKFTYNEALRHAKSETSRTGIAWRVPDKYELTSILDKSREDPSIDHTAFPSTPVDKVHWSSSPYVGDSDYAWFVHFGNGGVVNYGRRDNSFNVRLVHAGQLSDIGKEAQRRDVQEIRKEAQRQAQSERNSSVSSAHSGGFHMYNNMPTRGLVNIDTYWQASCDEGGYGTVNMPDSSPNFYCWQSHDKSSSSGCEAGIGAEAAMRNACR